MVSEAVGDVSRGAEGLAEFLGSVYADSRLPALQAVAADDLPYADTDGAEVVVAGDEGVDNLVGRLVSIHVLDALHHVIDALLLFRKLVRAGFSPEGLVLVVGVRKHLDLAVAGIQGLHRREVQLLVRQLAGADHRYHPGRVAEGQGEVGVQVVALVEPGGVLHALVVGVQYYVPDPVDVAAFHHLGLDAAEGVFLRVYVHLTVERRRRYAGLGVIAHDVGLAAVHLDGIDDVVVVEQHSVPLDGGREFDVERVDEGAVEVDPQVHAAGELAQHVGVRVDAGDAVCGDDLVVHGGVGGVAPVYEGL